MYVETTAKLEESSGGKRVVLCINKVVGEVVEGWSGCVVALKVARAYRPNKTTAVDRMFTAVATQLNVLIMKNRSPASFHNDTGHLLI